MPYTGERGGEAGLFFDVEAQAWKEGGRGERGEGRGVRRVGAGKGGEGGREKIFFRTIFGEEVENLWMNVGRYSETHLLDWFKHLLRV
jgi:hypothetical protein